MQSEGMQDYWSNPKGSWMNLCAVRKAYRYLGCDENACALFRPGPHRHSNPDFNEFLTFMRAKLDGKPTPEHLLINPYPDVDVDSYLF